MDSVRNNFFISITWNNQEIKYNIMRLMQNNPIKRITEKEREREGRKGSGGRKWKDQNIN